MPQINLLPWRQLERAQNQREFGLMVVGALMAAAAVTLLTWWGISSSIDRQRERNDVLKQEIAQLDKQITEILGLEAQRERLIARMEIISKLQRSRPEVVHVFDQLARVLPEGVYLTSVKQDDRKIELKGVAQSSTRVSTLMRNIEASAWLADPQLQVIEAARSGTGSDFTLLAVQKGTAPADDDSGKPKRPNRASGVPAK